MQDWFNHNFDKLLMSVVFGALTFIYLKTHDPNMQTLLGQAFTAIATLTGARLLAPTPSNGNSSKPTSGAQDNFRQ